MDVSWMRCVLTTPKFMRRRGVAALIAMMYLVIFATLAVGFYVSANSAVIVSDNEARGARGLAAAETGMDFTRYQLANIKVPANTQTSDLLSVVTAQLSPLLDGTANMKGHTVSLTNGTIYLPSSNDWITADSTTGMKFRVAITQNADTLVVKSVGMDSGASTQGRGVQLTYAKLGKGGI